MDLWIRSQDRQILICCKDITIKTNSEDGKTIRGYNIVGYFDKETEYEILGFYVKKERALEVLDEIQKRIAQNEILKAMIPKLTDIRGYEEKLGECFKKMIYEMPEE